MTTNNLQIYINGVRERNRRMLAKTITLAESSLPAHQQQAALILERLLPFTGKAIRLGISGVPGVGKSSFIESFGMLLIQKGLSVAVLAVDPSSPRSGGSIMADKTRMERLSLEENSFIRPSPSEGTLGGVARKTRETLLICEAAGFDVVIVETVGVGQSEVQVASMVDFFLVLMLAGAGDELQGIKKGILELADAIVITKADGDNVEKARMAQAAYENAFSLLVPITPTWRPPVLTCSALEQKGLETVWDTVLAHRDKLTATGEFEKKRRRQALDWMWGMVEEGLKVRFYSNSEVLARLPEIRQAAESGEITPTAAAHKLLLLHDKEGK